MLDSIIHDSESTGKTCPACGVTKPLSEFYAKRNTNAYETYCKPCHTERNKSYNRKPVNVSGEDHEQEVIEVMRSCGIYALPGKASKLYPYLDIIVWGCIRVEVKMAYTQNDNSWIIKFTPVQVDEGINADVIVIVCPAPGNTTYHVLPANHDILYTPDGNLRDSISWTPGASSAHSSYINGTLYQSKDKWGLLEEYRIKFMQQLKSGQYQEDRKNIPNFRQPSLL